MVWLNHAARETTARLLIVMVLMTLIPSADLFHCIIGSCEALYLVFQGAAPLSEAVRFFVAVVLGNTVGGVLLVGILNFAQTRRQRFPDRDCEDLALTWREFMFGQGTGRPRTAAANGQAGLAADDDEPESLLDQPMVSSEPEEESTTPQAPAS